MWRFILISFGFMGFAFYEASGGGDYAPAPGSIQVAMQDKSFFAPARDMSAPTAVASVPAAEPKLPLAQTANAQPKRTPTTKTEIRGGQRQEPVVLAGLSGIPKNELGGAGTTFVSASESLNGGGAMVQRPLDGIGAFSAETLVADVRDTPIDQAVVSTRNVADIRRVAGDSANMRSGPGTDFEAVDQLTRGTDVEVLDRRGAWVELRDLNTGQTGWMADWLVTAAN
ncbi:SH3 domain-containing protein [Roseovarius sp. D0-M9]|uniref:SH3 domain-containing protein n=1 Tax=Roseovarius sp. D0-M9 TaxID=3127117 RepID=UPI0030101423